MGRCDTCTGACCTVAGNPVGYPMIDVFVSDLERLSQYLGLPLDEAISRYVTPPAPGKHAWLGTLKMDRTGCLFLKDSRCSVYDARPDVCRTFDAETCTLYQVRVR